MTHDKGKVKRSQKLPGDAYLLKDSKNLQEAPKPVSVVLHENEHRTSNPLSPASPSSISTEKQDQLSQLLNALDLSSSSSSLAQNHQNYSFSSPQFGDARSSKNETTSEKRTALSVGHKSSKTSTTSSTKNYAENYRGFLLYLLREIWRPRICSGPYSVENAVKKNDLSLQHRGLYFIFWSAYEDADDTKKQDRIYPLYVGITGRTFKERFEKHINRDSGVIYKITNHQWPKKGEIASSQVIAYLVNMPLPVAKFFESVFLSAFNFPMNVVENGGMRGGIQITKSETVEVGFSLMQEHYEIAKSQLDKSVEYIFEKGYTYNLKYYNFKYSQ